MRATRQQMQLQLRPCNSTERHMHASPLSCKSKHSHTKLNRAIENQGAFV